MLRVGWADGRRHRPARARSGACDTELCSSQSTNCCGEELLNPGRDRPAGPENGGSCFAASEAISALLNFPRLFRAPQVCPIKFFGIDKMVQQLRQSFNKNVSRWSASSTVRENLEAVLEISFPTPQSAAREELTTECAICYAYVVQDEGNALLRAPSCASCGFHLTLVN